MDPREDPSTNAEAELESFRQKWREEVSKKTQSKAPVPSSSKSAAIRSHAPSAGPSSHIRQPSIGEVDEVAPHVYHDLGEKQHGRRLDETREQTAAALAVGREPQSALEHYEKAAERESAGNLGDSLNLYRKAFKLDDKVHETYKAKHFPPSYFKAKATQSATIPSSIKAPQPVQAPTSKPQDLDSSNASKIVPNTAHHSLQGLSSSLANLISDFSSLSILGEEPPTDLSPPVPCPIASLPEEILMDILEYLAIRDLPSFVRLAQVCKRLAYLVATEDRVWKRIATGNELGFSAMHYDFTCQINGKPLGDDGEGGFNLGPDSDQSDEGTQLPTPKPSPTVITSLLVPSNFPTYRSMFQKRPRVRFNGCYISTVNYTRPGQSSPTSVSWNSPIHIVTYYRYLRFLRDGTCISLLSTAEPTDVVPYLYIEQMHKNHGSLPSAPMKDAVLGRWRLTGPMMPDGSGESEGTLIVEKAGVTAKYFDKLVLSLGSAGRGAKNNKLVWQGYWSYNRLTDDWGEYGLRNDRAFYWSRVKSFGMSWDEKGRVE